MLHLVLLPDGSSSPSLTLLPEPLFSVANDGGVFLMTVRGTDDGRLFMGAKDGALWEMCYQVLVLSLLLDHKQLK